MLELYHRKPVLIVFCHGLQLMSKQTDNITQVSLDEPIEQLGYQRRIYDSMMTLKHRQICNRWCKAYTLINNPSLRQQCTNEDNVCHHDEVVTSTDSEA